MKTNFEAIAKEVCLLLGCVIGSGFVGGRELLLTFKEGDVFSVMLFVATLCSGLLVLLIFCFKQNLDDFQQLNLNVFKKIHGFLNGILILCNFVVTATILNVANDCLMQIFPISTNVALYSYVAAILSFFVMKKGIESVKKFSLVSMPIVLFYLVVVYIGNFDKISFLTAPHSSVPALRYAFFNVVMTLGVISSTKTRLKKRSGIFAIVAFSAVLLLFAVLQLSIANNNEFLDFAVPLFAVVKENIFLATAGAIAILLSALCSLVSNTLPIVEFVNDFTNDFSLAAALVFFLALLLSFAGFDFIVTYCFPAVSIVGVAIVSAVGFKLLTANFSVTC